MTQAKQIGLFGGLGDDDEAAPAAPPPPPLHEGPFALPAGWAWHDGDAWHVEKGARVVAVERGDGGGCWFLATCARVGIVRDGEHPRGDWGEGEEGMRRAMRACELACEWERDHDGWKPYAVGIAVRVEMRRYVDGNTYAVERVGKVYAARWWPGDREGSASAGVPGVFPRRSALSAMAAVDYALRCPLWTSNGRGFLHPKPEPRGSSVWPGGTTGDGWWRARVGGRDLVNARGVLRRWANPEAAKAAVDLELKERGESDE